MDERQGQIGTICFTRWQHLSYFFAQWNVTERKDNQTPIVTVSNVLLCVFLLNVVLLNVAPPFREHTLITDRSPPEPGVSTKFFLRYISRKTRSNRGRRLALKTLVMWNTLLRIQELRVFFREYWRVEVSLYSWLVWNQLYTTDNFCFYLQNRLIQTKQEANGTMILPPLVFPGLIHVTGRERESVCVWERERERERERRKNSS